MVTRVITRVVTPAAATPVPRQVVLCLADEPTTLDPLRERGDTAVALRALLGGVPIARGPDGTLLTTLFERVPTLENGDARLLGEMGPDAHLEVIFRVRANLRWEDGTPLTARDFRTAWEWAREGWGAEEVQAMAADVTDVRVEDERTFTVVLRPGLMTPLYATYVFGPYPTHLLANGGATDLRAWARRWPSFGLYRVTSWEPGKQARFDARDDVDSPPPLETVIVRFLRRPDDALVALLGGTCDVLDPRLVAVESIPLLRRAAEEGLITLEAREGNAWEHLDFNTWPPEGRTPFFADVRVRQAVALALDRAAIAQRVTHGISRALASWLPADHWAYQPLPPLDDGAPDLERARALLEEAGWVDEDEDGIREAKGVSGTFWDGTAWEIPDGTPFSVTLVTTEGDGVRSAVGGAVSDALAALGIRVTTRTLPPGAFFAAEGPLRRREFDMALFAWVTGLDVDGRYLWVGNAICRRANGTPYAAPAGSPCEPGDETLYPAQIPTAENGWQGGNVSGWANPGASLAIYRATEHIRPADRAAFYLVHQDMFGQDLPVLPLFRRPYVVAWRAGLTGVQPGPGTPLTWNIASWAWTAP